MFLNEEQFTAKIFCLAKPGYHANLASTFTMNTRIVSLLKWATDLADFMKIEVDTASFTGNRMCTLNHTIFTLQSRSPNAFGEV